MLGEERKAKLSKKLLSLDKEINRMGSELVQCDPKKMGCGGVIADLENGIVPRGFILDYNESKKLGVVVIGINPGNAEKEEKKYYVKKLKDNKPLYTAEKDLFFKGNKDFPNGIKELLYYKMVKHFIKEAGQKFDGAILWTELCECENKKDRKLPPPKTLRICIKKYLEEELKLVPDKTPIIALGNIAFEHARKTFPKKRIIGVPHPTGSRIFHKLFRKKPKDPYKRRLRRNYKRMLKKTVDNEGNPKCVRLFPPK